MAKDSTTLLLLRHAHVDGHRGDVPITDAGHAQARAAGAWLAEQGYGLGAVLYGGTRRTKETAEEILVGCGVTPDEVGGVEDSFALRNPDLYLGGTRVTMVSAADVFAEQTAHLNADDVNASAFFQQWLTHPERVGFWVGHPSPPGDDAATVARRVTVFARSLADAPQWRGKTVVAVTHSPVLRAVGLEMSGADPGEPAYLSGYSLTVAAGGDVIERSAIEPTTT